MNSSSTCGNKNSSKDSNNAYNHYSFSSFIRVLETRYSCKTQALKISNRLTGTVQRKGVLRGDHVPSENIKKLICTLSSFATFG